MQKRDYWRYQIVKKKETMGIEMRATEEDNISSSNETKFKNIQTRRREKRYDSKLEDGLPVRRDRSLDEEVVFFTLYCEHLPAYDRATPETTISNEASCEENFVCENFARNIFSIEDELAAPSYTVWKSPSFSFFLQHDEEN